LEFIWRFPDAFVLLIPRVAWATYIVDTGPGPNNVDITQVPSARYSSDQWLGFQIDLDRKTRITRVEGWMSVIPGGQGFGRIALYSDSSDLPGSLLYSTTFFGSVTDTSGTYSIADWLGAFDLDWNVNRGSYWITFEADRFAGSLVAGFLLPSGNPQLLEAYNNQGSWITAPLGLGARVSATEVSEPGPFALLATGLLALGFMRRHGRN
jgi:hypothetical protein